MSDEKQWIPVPPPNPYAANNATRHTPKRGLAITAMVVGLIAILTTAVAAFYFSVFVLLGAFLGLVAIVLGIIALVVRQSLKVASITGTVAGALSLLIAISAGGFALFALLTSGATSPEASGGTLESEPWEPDQQDEQGEQLLEWPANMSTGGLVFGPGAELLRSDPLETGATPGLVPVARNGEESVAPNDVLVYVDYRCPHCAQFDQLNGALLEETLNDGSITLEVKPLAFVDRNLSVQHSAAMACIADRQPDAAWAANEALLGPEAHAPGALTGEPGELVALLNDTIGDTVGEIQPAVAECISSERFVPFAQALSEWSLANPVPNAVDPTATVTGTPTIFVNGVRYEASPADPAAFSAFLEEQIR